MLIKKVLDNQVIIVLNNFYIITYIDQMTICDDKKKNSIYLFIFIIFYNTLIKFRGKIIQ